MGNECVKLSVLDGIQGEFNIGNGCVELSLFNGIQDEVNITIIFDVSDSENCTFETTVNETGMYD